MESQEMEALRSQVALLESEKAHLVSAMKDCWVAAERAKTAARQTLPLLEAFKRTLVTLGGQPGNVGEMIEKIAAEVGDV